MPCAQYTPGVTQKPGAGWSIGLIVAAVLALLVGATAGMFLLMGIAMGGDAVGPGYATWATLALIAYPVVALALIVFALVWGLTARGAPVNRRCTIALVLIIIAVPVAVVIALGLTFIGVSLS